MWPESGHTTLKEFSFFFNFESADTWVRKNDGIAYLKVIQL